MRDEAFPRIRNQIIKQYSIQPRRIPGIGVELLSGGKTEPLIEAKRRSVGGRNCERHGLNVEELSSTIFDGAIAACTKIRVTGRPGEACVQEIKAFSEVLHVDVVALPNMA